MDNNISERLKKEYHRESHSLLLLCVNFFIPLGITDNSPAIYCWVIKL